MAIPALIYHDINNPTVAARQRIMRGDRNDISKG